jgi:hypothetical protein
MEALGCGVPAVVGPTNGTGEYSGTGLYMFESYMPQAVAKSILVAWNDIRNTDPVTHVAGVRRTAEQHFSPSCIADRVTNLIHVIRRTSSQSVHD